MASFLAQFLADHLAKTLLIALHLVRMLGALGCELGGSVGDLAAQYLELGMIAFMAAGAAISANAFSCRSTAARRRLNFSLSASMRSLGGKLGFIGPSLRHTAADDAANQRRGPPERALDGTQLKPRRALMTRPMLSHQQDAPGLRITLTRPPHRQAGEHTTPRHLNAAPDDPGLRPILALRFALDPFSNVRRQRHRHSLVQTPHGFGAHVSG